MKKRPVSLSLVAAAVALSMAGPGRATTVTLDFEGGLPLFVTTNLVLGGFRVSPLCHFDFVPFPGRLNNTGVAMGFDRSGCLGPGSTNPSYLGLGIAAAASSLVFIDRAGISFDLLSLNGTSDLGVLSSNGGSFTFPIGASPDGGQFQPRAFTGAQWTNLSWIAFTGGGGGAPTTPVDNIALNFASAAVPEPSSLSLLGLVAAFAPLWAARRKKRLSTKQAARPTA